MSSRRVVGRNVVWNTAGLAAETVTGVLVMPFLIHALGDATYGVWIVLGALAGYFGLLDLGVRSSIGRHVALYHSAGDRRAVNQTVSSGLAVLVLVGSLALAGVLACEPLFFRLFDIPSEEHGDAGLALRVVAANLALSLVGFAFDAVLWGYQRFDWLNAVDIPACLLRAGLTFALVGSGGGLVALAAITLGGTAASGLAKAVLCFRADPDLRLSPRHVCRSAVRDLLGFGSWNLIFAVARITRTQLSPLLIGSILGLALVTPFSVAARLPVYISAALQAVTGVLTPVATAYHATGQADRQRHLYLVGGRHSAAFGVFLVAFLFLLGGPLLSLWVSPVAAAATPVLLVLAAGELLPSTQYLTFGLLQASARHRLVSVVSVLEAVSVGLLTALLLPALGLLGAGLAVAVPAVFARGLAPMVQGCRLTGVSVRQYLAEAIAPPVLCGVPPAAVTGAALYFHRPDTWVALIGYSVAYTALFGACYLGLIRRDRLRAARAPIVAAEGPLAPRVPGPEPMAPGDV